MTMLLEIGSIENVDAYLDGKFANKDKVMASVIVYIKMVILERNNSK